ncbi:M61 family metallopeptidase [Pedobacter glucosidilyticus]|uniref:M61 family metallopeptidase n=1 Tax=Pedobacter glucosidilyticus TaxID=1122941 RepID=UPI0003F9BB94|nr:PDZ domain-containing protein [Pedobacter glucosidilyticus]
MMMVQSTAWADDAYKVEFTVSFSEPQAHYADVEMRISNIRKKEIEVNMPVWAPGSYLVREFSKNVEGFTASTSAGMPLISEKIKKNSWKIKTNGNKTVVVNYKVYAFEVSVRTSFIDASHAFLSPTGIFMFVKDRLNEPVRVNITPYSDWSKVSTGLEKIEGTKFSYHVPDFDWLYDSPIEVGNQDIFEFDAAGVKHEVAMVGGGNYDKDRLKVDMAKIVEEETLIFRENPNKRYVFIVHHYQNGGGGLEHLNSTVLGAKRTGYTDPAIYTNFLSLVAHEYFHLWNVKRLRPIALGPFDYENENYTTDLWIAEGFTAYYDNLIIQRTGAISQADYLKILQSEINLIANQKGDKIQAVTEASFDAWIKYYRPNENSSNATISYYNKGALLAAMLDLAIIHKTNGEKSLDDVLRNTYIAYYKKKGRGFTSKEFKEALEKEYGENLDDFYNQYVNGTQEVNCAKYLAYAGLELVNRANPNIPSLGVRTRKNIISTVVRGGAAWNGGLNVNDEIIAVNGERVEDINDYIKTKAVGDNLEIVLNRDGIIQTLNIKLAASSDKYYQIDKMKKQTEQQKAVYKKWLKVQ